MRRQRPTNVQLTQQAQQRARRSSTADIQPPPDFRQTAYRSRTRDEEEEEEEEANSQSTQVARLRVPRGYLPDLRRAFGGS